MNNHSPQLISLPTDGSSDKSRYASGQKLAESWISKGGNLNADGPTDVHEAFFNGFIDRLTEERAIRITKS